MRLAALFSGGKDSTYAVHWALDEGHEVVLLTIRPPEYSMMFHHPNIDPTRMQAEALGLEQAFLEVGEDDWPERLKEALGYIRAEGIVSGAIASNFQRSRLQALADRMKIPSLTPLWHRGRELMEEMLRDYEIYVTAVSAEGLGPEFLGEPLEKLIKANKPGVHLFLEGGEGETFVANAPRFKKRIRITKWKKSWDGVRGVAEIAEAALVPK